MILFSCRRERFQIIFVAGSVLNSWKILLLHPVESRIFVFSKLICFQDLVETKAVLWTITYVVLLPHISIRQPQSSSSCCFFVSGEGVLLFLFLRWYLFFFYFLTFNSYDRKHIEEHLQVSHFGLFFVFPLPFNSMIVTKKLKDICLSRKICHYDKFATP